MKKPLRILLNLTTLLSTLLLAAILVVWPVSHRRYDQVAWRSATSSPTLATANGYAMLSLYLTGRSQNPPQYRHGPQFQSDIPRAPFNYILLLCSSAGDRNFSWQHGGFAWHQKRNSIQGSLHLFAYAPLWSLALLTGLLPLGWTTTRLRARRHPAAPGGLCSNCGYDLRATPNRCPECGTVP